MSSVGSKVHIIFHRVLITCCYSKAGKVSCIFSRWELIEQNQMVTVLTLACSGIIKPVCVNVRHWCKLTLADLSA